MSEPSARVMARLPALLCLFVLSACSGASQPLKAATCRPSLTADDLFGQAGVEGVFVLRDAVSGCTRSTDAAAAAQRHPPESTFKIANALIGLETGVIKGEHQLWPWDGTPRRLKAWEQDLDLAGALRLSCVPCFQDVARRVGRERMQRFLSGFNYGNQDISGPIDEFWLDGPLQISPREQVELLQRMLSGGLAVKRANVALIWRLLELEHGPGYSWRGKTGLGLFAGRAIGWLVGYVEREGHLWFYATFVQSRAGAPIKSETARLVPLRKDLTRAMLSRAGVLPGE